MAPDETSMDSLRTVVVTGLSGSGKSTVANTLEDLGYICVDNLPVALLVQFLSLCEAKDEITRVAVVVDARRGSFGSDPESVVQHLRADGHDVEVLFTESTDDALLRRFSETRRRHPLMRGSSRLVDCISQERALLHGLRDQASLIIDTTQLNVHQLRKRIADRYGSGTTGMSIVVMSFGYKYGTPNEADYIFDVRFLPNPYFVDGLREQTGIDPPVIDFLSEQKVTTEYSNKLQNLLDFVIPYHDNEGKVLLTFAVGCTGGRHRSVFVSERIKQHLNRLGHRASVFHRDIARP